MEKVYTLSKNEVFGVSQLYYSIIVLNELKSCLLQESPIISDLNKTLNAYRIKYNDWFNKISIKYKIPYSSDDVMNVDFNFYTLKYKKGKINADISSE